MFRIKVIQVVLTKILYKSCSADLEVLSAAILHVTQSVIMLGVIVLRVMALLRITDSLFSIMTLGSKVKKIIKNNVLLTWKC